MNRVPILEGRDFRQVWDENLTSEAKKRLRKAVRRGEALTDPGLASLGVSLARQRQRISLVTLASAVGALIVWIAILSFLNRLPAPTQTAEVLKLLAIANIVAIPSAAAFWIWSRRPRYRQAELKNLEKLEGD